MSLIEGLVGSASGDILAGDNNANELYGLAGNDSLIGNGGADMMRGGLGDDTYSVDNANDKAIEDAGQGNDTVNASVSFILAANVENLTLLEGFASLYGIGNDGSNWIIGNSSNNSLVGGAGSDILDGRGGPDDLTGGAGADALIGGDGFDYARYDGAPAGVYANLLTPSANNGDAAGDSLRVDRGAGRLRVRRHPGWRQRRQRLVGQWRQRRPRRQWRQ